MTTPQVIALSAEARGNTGTGDARALRREGKVPAIVYGGKQKELSIAINAKELIREYHKGNFTSKPVNLTVGSETIRVLPRDIQIDPVTDFPIHADFMRVVKGEEVLVKVKVRFINTDKSPGIKRGGVLNIVRRYVDFICDTDHIPETITVDLEGTKIGQSIHISHVELPKNARPAITDRDFTIATVAGRTSKDEDETAASSAAAAPGAAAAATPGAAAAPAAGAAAPAAAKAAPAKK